MIENQEAKLTEWELRPGSRSWNETCKGMNIVCEPQCAIQIPGGRFRLVDLSVPLEDRSPSEPIPAKIHYVDHQGEGREQLCRYLGVRASDLIYSQGEGWALEHVEAITHTGTHLDAPYHYGRTSAGKPAATVDQVPLSWCFAPGVLLDMRHKPPGSFITVDDLHQELKRIGYRLSSGDIVLIHTGAARRIGTPSYFEQPGLGREGVLYLVEQGVRVIGIDAYTLDRPFRWMQSDYRRSGDGRFIWPAHFAGLTRPYCQIEKLCHLDRIGRPWGFWVICFPVKIHRASAAWCRAVALVPEEPWPGPTPAQRCQ